MASTYNDKNLNTNSTSSTNLSKSVSKTVSGNSTASSANSNSSGTSTASSSGNSYSAAIGSAMASAPTFNASSNDNVTSAQSYLDSVIANKPGSYESKYTSQLSTLYNNLMNRGSFSYNMNGDALYQMYNQRYKQQGLQSMRDTMGQAAANTGGYGSSYAQTAGQSAYNSYINQLAEQVPTLQSQAQSRYDDETTRMTNQYNLVKEADDTDYSRSRDTLQDWKDERTYAQNRYDTAYNNAYNEWSDRNSTATTIAGWAREDASNAQTQAQNQVSTWLSAGVMPSRAVIEAAGLDYDSVKAYYDKTK